MAFWTVHEQGRGVVLATFSNPPGHYATPEVWQELEALVASWPDPAVRAVVLCGQPGSGAFITHFSVEHLVQLKTTSPPEALRNLPAHRLRAALRDLPKPVIAALNGNAMGGGFELALACDLRIGEHGDFRYGLPETRLGIIPAGGGTQRLARLIGAGRAIEFILRGRIVTPAAALSLGLIHEVSEDAVATALGIATELANLPPCGLAAAKAAVYQGSDTDLATGLEVERAEGYRTLVSEDALTAMRSYLAQPIERRRSWFEQQAYPDYSGR